MVDKKISKKERQEAKEYIKLMLPRYLEREGINPERNFKCLSPSHDDSFGDMSYHKPSNTCVCHCGAHYDTFDLIGIEYGLTDFNKKFEKGCEIFGLLGKKEDSEAIKIPVGWRNDIPEYKLPERASDEECSMAYFALTKCKSTKLRPEHEADLLRRGLTKEDIKRFRFCSTPERGKQRETAQEVCAQGIFPNKVPGFYLERHFSMVNDAQGYYCPVFNGERNQILSMVIRVDEPKKGKYIYFSSPNKENGTSSGAIPTILPGKNAKVWIITEGILKALIIYCLLGKEISVIGVPGVGTLGGVKSFLEEREGADMYFFEAYDMDKVDENKAVKQAQEKLLETITKYGYKSHTLSWDTKNGSWQKNYKGLDDFLCEYTKTEGNREKFIKYLMKTAMQKEAVRA